jgi:hypothetical protein
MANNSSDRPLVEHAQRLSDVAAATGCIDAQRETTSVTSTSPPWSAHGRRIRMAVLALDGPILAGYRVHSADSAYPSSRRLYTFAPSRARVTSAAVSC